VNINISEMVRAAVAQALRDVADQLSSIQAPSGQPAPRSRTQSDSETGPVGIVRSLAARGDFATAEAVEIYKRAAPNISSHSSSLGATIGRLAKRGEIVQVRHGMWRGAK